MALHPFLVTESSDRSNNRLIFRRRELMVSLVGLAIAACRSNQQSPDSRQLLTEGASTMKLESAVFEANQTIPTKYTCDGEDVSPPLTWDDPPTGTQSLVLICDDPDAPRGTWVHWVVYNLPPDVRNLPEGIPSQPTLSNGGIQGTNDFRKLGYGGPCPPSGSHRYFFKLYALDTLLDLEPGATKAQIEQAMQSHILAGGELIGNYTRSR
jgi:Raf kinase inhibitor-like YbhB/YbcL family protein